MIAPGLDMDMGMAVLVPALGVAAFGGAWVHEKSQRIRVRHAAFCTVMAYLVGVGLWMTREGRR